MYKVLQAIVMLVKSETLRKYIPENLKLNYRFTIFEGQHKIDILWSESTILVTMSCNLSTFEMTPIFFILIVF